MHEVPIHVELNTISGGFSRESSPATKRKWYVRVVMSLETADQNDAPKPDLYFRKADLADVVPHNNDPVVISIITVGRVHQVLFDQGSSTNVIF